SAQPMDLGKLLGPSSNSASVCDSTPVQNTRIFDPAIPTIGIYGKVGEVKGSYDLLRALGRLRREKIKFNFLAMTHGVSSSEEAFQSLIGEQELAANTWLLPFVPPWRVPSFIRCCTAVCFLERNFPISMHAPVVPREVLACGTC